MSDATLIVIAKAPVPGAVKTRLCPPCTPHEAAELAEAALADTLDAALSTRAARHLLVLDGAPGGWLLAGFDVVAQAGGGLDARLAAAFVAADGPALLVGMDTPQVTPDLLRHGLELLRRHDAVLGPAPDGGYWAIGLRRPDPAVFLGVPMSEHDTCAVQREQLRKLGLTTAALPALVDVDTIADAHAVARVAPATRFGAALRALRQTEGLAA